jgi:TusA-related sulfurtransferase
MEKIQSDATIDITDVVCPMTFVKTKAAIEELETGQILEVLMNEGEPVQNVPRSMKEEGQQVLRLEKDNDGKYRMYVKKLED